MNSNENDRNQQQNNNVIYLPDLAERFVEKGLDALQNKDFSEAEQLFQQALQIDDSHPQAHFGFMLVLFERGLLNDAKEQCEKMLREDIWDYYEVFQVYVSILIQLKDYQKVIHMIEAVLQENHFPVHLAESLYQWLHFCRENVSHGQLPSKTETEEEQQPKDIEKQRQLINSSNVEKQWLAIQNLNKIDDSEATDVLKTYLKDKEKDPFLKSVVLQMLKERHLTETIEIHKFDQTISVEMQALDDMFADDFSQTVQSQLSKTLMQENPTLYEIALQLWEHFSFSVFPIPLVPDDAKVWAAAIDQYAHDINGIETNTKKVPFQYQVLNEDVQKAVEKIKKVEGCTRHHLH